MDWQTAAPKLQRPFLSDAIDAESAVLGDRLWQSLVKNPPTDAHLAACLIALAGAAALVIRQGELGPDSPQRRAVYCRQWFCDTLELLLLEARLQHPRPEEL